MNYLSLINAVRARVAAAWPEVAANGIYHGAQLAAIPFDQKAEAGQLPLAVLDFDLRDSGEWGGDNRVKEGTVTVYYVVAAGTVIHLEDDLLPRLEALRAALWTSGLSYGQVLDDPTLAWGMALAPNTYFLMNARPFMAGAVSARIVAGEGP